MAKTGEAESVTLDVAASLARTAATGKTQPSETSTSLGDADMALEARLTALFNAEDTQEAEPALVSAFLSAPRASQKLLTLKLLANPNVDQFPELLQFLLRVMMAAHARSHEEEVVEASGCSYARNVAQSCMLREEEGTGVAFALPESFHACLALRYGSVKRLKCEEVWHGDHMAYRCRTCGLSDSSCMCLACFDPEEHEGHDYRVYRCSSGGCCDCGDPLAWKPEGFCKKHSAERKKETGEDGKNKSKMHPDEAAVVNLLVRSAMDFCVDVLREVHVSCLRPRGGGENADVLYPRRTLPRTGLLRSALPSVVKVHVDRLQQTLAWLQMLSMSCLYYRNLISDMFFEELPAGFQLDAVAMQSIKTVASLPVDESPVEAAPTSGESEEDEAEEEGNSHGPLLMLDVFLKAGVLLPVETCDVLGVLYLKLLFDQSFKQKYTCHFVEWYPYFIELYLSASDENNDDGMRNLSRFIDRLFCQLFHSNAQLRELETVFASIRPTFNPNETRGFRRRRRRRPHHANGISAPANDSTPSSCVEWLMVFLLEKLNDLFRSTLRLMTILPQPLIDGTPMGARSTSGSSTSTVGIGTVPEAPPVLRTVQAVDCGRNVFKKRIYARLCSDLRTLLVHPQIAAKVLLRSFRCIGGDECALHEASVYAQLMKTFELLQQMDLQTRHVHRHIEYESQNWTFAFVADYELKLLLSAFLTGVPACFSREVWQSITTGDNSWNQGATGVITGGTPLNPLEGGTFRPLTLARALLQPVRTSLSQWANRNGRPEFVSEAAELAVAADPGEETVETETATISQLMKYYEQGTVALGGASAKSFHFPLHHMYAALIHALCGVVRPQTMEDWRELLGMGSTDGERRKDLAFWYGVLDHPLRVLLFSREIKAGLWVRNGGVMLQQLIHYHSKHWRYFGLHSDLFLCQLGACLLPHGSFARLFFHQLPFGVRDSTVLRLRASSDMRTDGVNAAANADRSRELRQELDVVEEALRLLLQLVLAPVKLASASSPETAAVWLLEREIMHWLTLGPFTRSEVIMRTDMKLVEQIKQLPAHEWAELEEEEILTHVLENVGMYDDPVGSSNGSRSGSLLGYGLKMSGSWKLKPELWLQVSPLFECFTPSEAQQCEQNIRKNLPKPSDEASSRTTSTVLPILPRPQHEGASGVDMHAVLAETILNSSYTASVLLVICENYRRRAVTQSRSLQGDDDEQGNASSATNENLLLAALHCLYVAVEMAPKAIEEEHPPTASSSSNGRDSIKTKRSLDDIAERFDEESSLFVKLRTEVPLADQEAQAQESNGELDGKTTSSSSLLSLLSFFAGHEGVMVDAQPVVKRILQTVREKSPSCDQYLDAVKRRQLEETSNSATVVDDDSTPNNSVQDVSDGKCGEQPKLTAKEMMRRRQQQILEKMRSQQMQFLSANGDAMEDDTQEPNRSESAGNGAVDTDSDSYDDSMDSEEDVGDDHEEEEDEWGFPTGQVDVRLYLDHVSSAIAQMRDKQRKAQDRRRRRRRSTRSSSITAENDERGRSSSISYDFGSISEQATQTEECGLCRLPCDPRSRDSSFGFVGMILPTNMPQKIEKSSPSTPSSDVRPAASSRLPSLRVLKPGTTDEMRMQLADCVIWSCGHAIHHTCLKAYLTSLWKQKHGRSALETTGGEDRLLSEREMEFVCPICRRLSNCLVPRVSLGELQEQASVGDLMSAEFGSDEEEEEEKKDDGQDPLAFLQWLDTQMSFRDDSPVVKRRRSRTQSSLRLRRRLLSSASKSSLSPGPRSSAGSASSRGDHDAAEQDVSVEREIGAFCHQIVLRSVCAQLYLPTLLTSSIRDEGSLDLEMQQLSSECGAQTPAWQLLLHCLEVQLRVVAREKTLLQTDAVDPLQLRSMRQLADITAAAVAFSTPSSLAWTVVEAPAEKQFESVMTRLNGLVFGQQVLFEEDEDASSTTWGFPNQLQPGDADDATDAALVGTPMLCHPRLVTCFAMRLMWRRSIATPNAEIAAEQLLTEAFFSARVFFTAQVLQALAYLSMQNDLKPATDEAEEIRDFEEVESLRDASAWISLMLARSRLMDNTSADATDPKQGKRWSASAVEEQVSALCLPLAQQMLLLMDVVLPVAHQQHSEGSQGDGESKAPAESCAVCDGLFPSTSTSNAKSSASALLNKCLRRLHLPPLRLFFHREMFPSSQRALCQLWGAQLEAKAAVSRRQARIQAGESATQVDAFPLQRQVLLLSSQAAAVAAAGANYRLLIPLPRVYMELFIRYNEKPTGVCRQCAQVPQHPGLCLFCGEVLCCFSACCEAKEGGGVGECTQHAQRCGLGLGAFLLLRACTVILFLGNERRCVWGSLYVDKNGEEDPYLRRGKTLYLDSSRRLALETLLVSHSFSQNTAILQNTSRRDGRRY